VGATMGAHALAYALVVPDPQSRALLLAATGHGWLPLVLAILISTAALSLAGAGGALPEGSLQVDPRRFVYLPPLAFAVQEHLERVLHDGAFPWHAALDPTFGPGLLLTIPFGVAAFLLARAVLRVARRIALRFAPRRFRRVPAPFVALAPAVDVLRPSAIALKRASRGPPAVR
jgi:hypothetical protein